MRDPYDVGRLGSELFEVEPNAHGWWRRRQLARECLRVCYATGERLQGDEWAFMRPIMDSRGLRSDPQGVRNLARAWGLKL